MIESLPLLVYIIGRTSEVTLGRPLGLLVLILVSGVTAFVMGYGAAATFGETLVWRNVILLLLMLVTAVVSLVNGVALWRRGAAAFRLFVVWYIVLALTLLSRHLYLAWEWTRVSNLVVELGLMALIGIVLARYVRSQLSVDPLGPFPV